MVVLHAVILAGYAPTRLTLDPTRVGQFSRADVGQFWLAAKHEGPPGRAGQLMAYDRSRDRVVLTAVAAGPEAKFDEDVWEWDGSQWTKFVTSCDARGQGSTDLRHTLFWADSVLPVLFFEERTRRIVLLGPVGSTDLNYVVDRHFVWDGESWTHHMRTRPLNLLEPMAYDASRNELLLFESMSAATWSFRNNVWDMPELGSDRAPSPRLGSAMAFGASAGEFLLFGGTRFASLLDDTTGPVGDPTWTFDGYKWTERTGHGPPSRVAHAMAYDSNGERILLFGGLALDESDAPMALGDLWAWDGEWHLIAENGPARAAHAMAFDSAAGHLVVFGGARPKSGTDIDFLGDTWIWDGRSWSRAATEGPPARGGHAMAYHPVTATTVMFGGTTELFGAFHLGGGVLGDAWEWRGGQWSSMKGRPLPPGRWGHYLVFHDGSGSLLLLGGQSDAPAEDDLIERLLGDVWAWYPGPAGTDRPSIEARYVRGEHCAASPRATAQ